MTNIPNTQYIEALVFNKGVNPKFIMEWVSEFGVTRDDIAETYKKADGANTIIDCALGGLSLNDYYELTK